MIKKLPKTPPLWLLMGPAFIWAAIAQGSGELIWWPYFAAKYGSAFLGLLLPACLIQFFVNREISRYTAITGQGIWHGFLSLGKLFAIPLFLLCFVNFLWLGGYASAGGTALFEITRFPANAGDRGGSLFWAYALMIGFSLIFIFSKIIYQSIEKFMKLVTGITIVGLLISVFNPTVISAIPQFLKSFLNPLSIRWPSNWQAADTSPLVTAIAFAGMGGFLNLLYSYWMKDKGVGMAFYSSKITGLLTKNQNQKEYREIYFEDNAINQSRWKKWLFYLNLDSLLAVVINAITASLTTLLAFAILHPRGVFPDGWKIAVVQAEFFRGSFGSIGVTAFLVIAAAFMIDTWLGLVDGVARQFADFFHKSGVKHFGFRFLYYFWLAFLIVISFVTVTLAQPGVLITIVGVISIYAFTFYIPALWFLNYYRIPQKYPHFVKPQKWESVTLAIAWIFYLVVALYYTVLIL